MDTLTELIKTLGFPLTLAVFFIWRDWQSSKDQKRRETRLGERLDKIVDDHNRVTETVIVNNTSAMLGVKESQRELRDEIRSACQYRNGRAG